MRKKRLPINRRRIRELPRDTGDVPMLADIIKMARRWRFPKGDWFLGKETYQNGEATKLYCMVGMTDSKTRALFGVSTIYHDAEYPYRDVLIRWAAHSCWDHVTSVRVRRSK